MYKITKEMDIISRMVYLTVPTNNKIEKVDIVENMGVGIWFTDSDFPSIILGTRTDKESELLMKSFCKTNLKSKIKVL